MSKLRIMSWNIFWCLGYPTSTWSYLLKSISYFRSRKDSIHISKIANFINESSPDILTLQEIDIGSKRNGNFNQVKTLSNATKLNHKYFAVEKDRFNYFKDGNAILSTLPFHNIYSKLLPYTLEKRNYIVSEVKVGKKKITIIATHLSPRNSNQKERLLQVKALCKIITKLRTPIILMGDLNCEPTSEEFIFLKENAKLQSLTNKPTFLSCNPKNTYDHVLISKGIKVKSVTIPNTQASDHLPVVVDVEV